MAKEIIKGIFITFEGAEGSGKSTQARLLYDYLKKKGFPLLYLREPGGVRISEAIRRILLDAQNKNMSSECELLLYMAARAQVVNEIILPALKAGKIIICDRFLDSTLAYQGFGLGVNFGFIKQVGGFVTYGVKPDLTILLDLPTEKGLRRCGESLDRIEKRPLEYHRRVRNGYLKLAKLEPQRIKVVRADAKKSVIQDEITKLVHDAIQRYKRPR